MLNKIKYLSIIFTFLIFCGCGSYFSAPKVKPVLKQYPSWIISPQQDSEVYMYGVAVEENREIAIKSALNDMISKLGTTLESSYESYQEVEGSYFKTNVKNRIKSDIAKIKINNYEVIKSQRINY